MSLQLIAQIGKTPRFSILELLKRKGGRSIDELSALLNMSYMGVKKHCVDLQQGGYLKSWRRISTKGRPQLEYRLSKKAQALFESTGEHFAVNLLQISVRLFGSSSAEKLLFTYFQERAEEYLQELNGLHGLARIQKLSELRNRQGYYSSWEEEPCFALIDNHHPLFSLFEMYPNIQGMEHRMLEEVMEQKLHREETTIEGIYRCVYSLR